MTQNEPDSVTVEEADLLYSLVRMAKPNLAIETGTGHAIATKRIAEAVRDNGKGFLISCDTDTEYILEATRVLDGLPVSLRCSTGNETLASLPRAEFVFIDGGNADTRMKDLELIVRHDLLAQRGILVVHDTINPKYRKLADYLTSNGFVGLSLDSIGGIGFFQRRP